MQTLSPIHMAKKPKIQKSEQLQQLPEKFEDERRIFCDRAFVIVGDEHFVLALQSGNVMDRTYSLTPGHAKRLMQLLEKQVAIFEQKHGKLNVSLPTSK